jgi:hypothetical protein
MSTFDLIIRSGRVANPPGGISGEFDIGIKDGEITEVAPGIDPGLGADVIDAQGEWVLPGLIDPHVHVSGRFGEAVGCRMLVRAGITTALDLAGDPADLLDQIPSHGCGLTLGVVVPVIPGMTVTDRDPEQAEIDALLERSLEAGALGLKALGGHFPITPGALDRVLDACTRTDAYCAVHAGTTETGSDVSGLEELVAIANGRRVQVAHVNSYCRGQIEDPVVEAGRAVSALRNAPGAMAESYLAIINGAMASCSDGVPDSDVVKTCLRLGGYEQTESDLRRAIVGGWAQIHVEDGEGVELVGPEQGLAWFEDHDTNVGVSFAVNPPAAALAIALSRHADRSFVIGGIGSDGGSLPRNTTLRQGLALVEAGSLTISDLVQKSSTYPAEMLGLPRKGRIAPAADADVIIASGDGVVQTSVIGGKVIIRDAAVVEPGGGTLLCSAAGVAAAQAANVPSVVSAR